MSRAFPELVAEALAVPSAYAPHGELVVLDAEAP
jgi:hypothetical protein